MYVTVQKGKNRGRVGRINGALKDYTNWYLIIVWFAKQDCSKIKTTNLLEATAFEVQWNYQGDIEADMARGH